MYLFIFPFAQFSVLQAVKVKVSQTKFVYLTSEIPIVILILSDLIVRKPTKT